jgi:hypothetical protein
MMNEIRVNSIYMGKEGYNFYLEKIKVNISSKKIQYWSFSHNNKTVHGCIKYDDKLFKKHAPSFDLDHYFRPEVYQTTEYVYFILTKNSQKIEHFNRSRIPNMLVIVLNLHFIQKYHN